MNTLIVVVGPTGVGKSEISIQLARHYHSEIISADSRQLFKELRIGTAAPTMEEMGEIPHHLVRTKSIADYYNVSAYEADALKIINELFLSKNLLILAGGSMMYVDTVCKGIDDIPTVDQDVRREVLEWYHQNGLEALRQRLMEVDPQYYAIADLNNYKRLLHAVEVHQMTGLPISSFRTNQVRRRPFKILKIGINQDRAVLYERINRRVERMMEEGLLDEARSVYRFRELNSLNTVGYKELFMYFDQKCSLEEAVDLIKRNTRKYARKQLTWFRRDPEIHWFEPGQLAEIINFIDQKLDAGE